MTIKTVHYDQSEALAAIAALHAPDGFDADLSYGNGRFYAKMEIPRYRFDIDPQVEGVEKASSTAIPLGDGSLRSIVFDPPFLTYVRDGRGHKGGAMALSSRFGGYWRYDELEAHYRGTLRECVRLLVKGGIMVFKCQDIVHNHRLHCTHANTIGWAAEVGFRLRDLFVLAAKHRMPIPPAAGAAPKQQRHARIHHSYFLVLERL